MFVMLFINVLINVPELNFPALFSIKAKNKDPEREHLANAVSSSPTYTQFHDDDTEAIVAVSSQTPGIIQEK
jgi:hypothetical protein